MSLARCTSNREHRRSK